MKRPRALDRDMLPVVRETGRCGQATGAVRPPSAAGRAAEVNSRSRLLHLQLALGDWWLAHGEPDERRHADEHDADDRESPAWMPSCFAVRPPSSGATAKLSACALPTSPNAEPCLPSGALRADQRVHHRDHGAAEDADERHEQHAAAPASPRRQRGCTPARRRASRRRARCGSRCASASRPDDDARRSRSSARPRRRRSPTLSRRSCR